MTVLVTDTGFATPAPVTAVTLAEVAAHQGVLDLAHTDDPALVEPHLAGLRLIRISFPAFSDGRAFTIARRLRALGYRGRLRAFGPMISDQYPMARRIGFDDVEIPDDLAARQPQTQWRYRAADKVHDYQSRLRA